MNAKDPSRIIVSTWLSPTSICGVMSEKDKLLAKLINGCGDVGFIVLYNAYGEKTIPEEIRKHTDEVVRTSGFHTF